MVRGNTAEPGKRVSEGYSQTYVCMTSECQHELDSQIFAILSKVSNKELIKIPLPMICHLRCCHYRHV